MLGPTFGHIAASITGLVLAEKLAMDYLVAPWAPTLSSFDAILGRTKLVALLGFAVTTCAFWGLGGIMALPACFHVDKWKIQANRTMDFSALLAALPLVAFNFVTGIGAYVLTMSVLLPESAFDWHALPDTTTLTRDVVIWLLLQEVSFFYSHKFLHENKRAYSAIHKLHHTWTAPVSLVGIYCHPLENLFSNIVPVLLGPMLCRSHVASILVFLFLGMIHNCAVHSGYWFCDDDGMHDEHHRKFTVNYGVTGLMDSWYGTYSLPTGAVGGRQPGVVPTKHD